MPSSARGLATGFETTRTHLDCHRARRALLLQFAGLDETVDYVGCKYFRLGASFRLGEKRCSAGLSPHDVVVLGDPALGSKLPCRHLFRRCFDAKSLLPF